VQLRRQQSLGRNVTVAGEDRRAGRFTPTAYEGSNVQDAGTDPSHLPVDGSDPVSGDKHVRRVELAVDEGSGLPSQDLHDAVVSINEVA
jgi:hypothetical protein